MLHEVALAVAHGRSRSASAVSNAKPCSSRAQSACSQPAGASGGTLAPLRNCSGPQLGTTMQKQSTTRDAYSQVIDSEQTRIADMGRDNPILVQGYAVHPPVSEKEQYPNFFAWISTQENKQLQTASKQRSQNPQPSSTGSRTSSGCMSVCSKQKPVKEQLASWLPTTSLMDRTQAGISPSGQHERRLLSEDELAQQHQHAHTMRPASADQRQQQLQRCHQQANGSRPRSALGLICTQITATNSKQQTIGDIRSISKEVPCWLRQVDSQACLTQAEAAQPSNLSIIEYAVHHPKCSDGSDHHTASSPVQDGLPHCTKTHSSRETIRNPLRPACSMPDSIHHLQQHWGCQSSQHAAQQLFQRLPLADGAAVDRHTLQLMMVGLQCELARLGPPATLRAPDLFDNAQPTAQDWSAHDQVDPELQLWDKLTSELCRQARVECAQRGVLMLTAVTRLRQLLHSALSVCDSMYSKMQEAAKASQQLIHTINSLKTGLQHAQQQESQLQANLQDEQQKLAIGLRQLQQQQDTMRKGRFHLIAEEVEIAKQEIENRWMKHLRQQLQQVRDQYAAELAAGTQQLQEKMLRLVRDAAGDDVSDTIRAQILREPASP